MTFFYNSDFSPLFRLLDDYETHRSRPTRSVITPSDSAPKSPATSKSTRSCAFTPAFDVRELNGGYYLDGELPGVDQRNIEIEFSDPHTLVIKGRTERNYQTDGKDSQSTSPRWRQPTVEDEDEAISTETGTVDSTATSNELTTDDSRSPFHYWASERSIGEFQRTFTFPVRVDQDAVRASLKNGILSVIVPKVATPKAKRIRID